MCRACAAGSRVSIEAHTKAARKGSLQHQIQNTATAISMSMPETATDTPAHCKIDIQPCSGYLVLAPVNTPHSELTTEQLQRKGMLFLLRLQRIVIAAPVSIGLQSILSQLGHLAKSFILCTGLQLLSSTMIQQTLKFCKLAGNKAKSQLRIIER